MIPLAFDVTRLVVGPFPLGALLVVCAAAALLMLIVWPVFLLALFL